MKLKMPFLLLVLLPASIALADDKTITVSAGKLDRTDAIVTFPANLDPKTQYQLHTGPDTIPLQILPDHRALFVLKQLKANTTKTYTIEPTRAEILAGIPIQRDANNLTFTLNQHEVLKYNGDLTPLPVGYEPSYQRGGYISPIFTPSGKLVSDDYADNHRHHHALWAAWTKTDFEGRHPDFWNMGDKKGRVEFVSLDSTFTGPLASGLSAKHRYVDLTAPTGPKTALNETWETTVYRVGTDPNKPYFLFDVTLTQTCATDQPLILPKYLYGGIAFRGHKEWNGKGDACTFLTSEDKDRTNGNETRARWCYIGGKIPGENGASTFGGLTILSHPSNFRSPQPVRIHPDMPYFTFAPQQLGEFKIEPGTPYVSHYRIVTTDGPADKDLFDRLWNDFATPAEVTIK
jgi:hypothetical protein